ENTRVIISLNDLDLQFGQWVNRNTAHGTAATRHVLIGHFRVLVPIRLWKSYVERVVPWIPRRELGDAITAGVLCQKHWACRTLASYSGAGRLNLGAANDLFSVRLVNHYQETRLGGRTLGFRLAYKCGGLLLSKLLCAGKVHSV